MHIHIKQARIKICRQHEPFSIDIDPSSTIKQVKDMIALQINIHSSDQFLSFEGRELEDEQTLASYDGIKDSSTIWMVIYPNVSHEKHHVFISIGTDDKDPQIIDLYIHYYDTVDQVKHAIYECTGIPTARQILIFAGKQMEDGVVFIHYEVQKDSTVRLITRG